MKNKTEMDIGEVFILWWIRMKNNIYLYFVGLRNIFVLIKSKKLRKIDKEINYYTKNEFSYEKLDVERKESKLDKEELTYGETPYFTVYNILKESKIKKGMTVYDLGSGLGRFAFLARLIVDVKVIGVDIIPSFIEFTNKLVDKYKLNNIEFIKANLFESDISQADIIYIAGTCFNDISKKMLEEKIKTVKKGAKVVTLSYSLKNPCLKIKKVKKMWFSWGWATVYFQERI